jgi:SAM-dependent methyltransferase
MEGPGTALSDWKAILYQSYVSSGQVRGSGGSAEQYLQGRRAYFESVIQSHFPRDRESRILDIGCGHGALLYFLRKAGYQNIRGVDGSREQVELSQRLGIVGVELGEAQSVIRACASDSLDVVVLFDVLEHLTRQETFDLLIEVQRVLSAKGVCIGHVPNAEGIFGSRIRYSDLTHEQAFTSSSISQVFGSLKFGQVRCFEDKPMVHGVSSALRRILWEVGTVPMRILFAAETPNLRPVLSQNLLFVAQVSHHKEKP